MVGPVAALRADGARVPRLEQPAEIGDVDELDAPRPFLGIPALDEIGHAPVRRAIVDAHRVGGFAIEKVERIGRIGFELGDPARQQPVDQVPVAEARLAAAEQVVVAVPGQHRLAAGAFPAEGAGEGARAGATDRVDGGGVEVDAQVGEQVGEQPGDAVDVVLHGGLDLEAEFVADGAQRVERAMHLLDIEQRGEVVLHGRDVDAALIVPMAEPAHLARVGAPEIAQEWTRGLDRPAVARCRRIAVGRLDQVERLLDEFAVLAQRQILVVGEADIGMRVVADIDGLDLGQFSLLPCSPPL